MAKIVSTLSDSAFFVKTIDAPAGLSAKDYPDFVDTAAETFSPFPIEKLRRGYAVRGNSVAIFAGLDERIFSGKPESDYIASQMAIPAAALAFYADLPDGEIFFKTDKSLALISIDSGKWKKFNAVKLSGDIISDARALAKMQASSTEPNSIPLCSISSPIRPDRKKVSFELEFFSSLKDASSPGASGDKKTFSAPVKLLACADVRDKSLLKTSGKSKLKNDALMLALKAVPAAFALLIIMQVAVYFKEKSLENLESELAKLEPQAKLVEKQSEYAAELAVFNSDKLRSIRALAIINSTRPDEISFARTLQESPKDVEIQGTSTSVGKVNEFVESLKSNPEISQASAKSEVNRGAAKFTIRVKLK